MTEKKLEKPKPEPEKASRKYILIGYILVIIAILTPIFFYFCIPDTNGDLFMRSGALVVTMSIFSGLLIARASDILSSDGNGKYCAADDFSCELYCLRALKYVDIFIAAVGTIIWGYGDCIFF
jgi:hypothetical protein